MVSLTSSSSSTPKISFDFTKNNITTSFNVPVSSSASTYLKSKEEAVVTTNKLMEHCKLLNINPKGDPELVDEKQMVKKALEDPEIGVFGAEKYFSGDMDSDQSSSVLSLKNPEVVDLKQREKKSTGAPSLRSESSWNSQSMLLQNKLENTCNGYVQEKKINSGQIQKVVNNKKSFLLNLGCKCACSDGISVDVDDKILVKRSSDPIKIQKQEELVQRKSLEVAQKKLTLPPWQSITDEEDTKSEGSKEVTLFQPHVMLQVKQA
ncbi:Protein PHYTOCHROME KINASE SUBSTRATE 1 [Raphanus sativus]|nr:Protein PHYTOCHROME KINASE SUBSTRATE 1 [Raphanus sativus]